MYRNSSNWNDANEIRCLIILKKLQALSFPRGKQIELCRKMAKVTSLDTGTINAKIGNYKSVAGINKPSNASQNTKVLYEKFKNHSISKLEALVVLN